MALGNRNRATGADYAVDVLGLPQNIPVEARAVFESRFARHVRELFDETGLEHVDLRAQRRGRTPATSGLSPQQTPGPAAQADSAEAAAADRASRGELDLEQRMTYFPAVEPEYDLNRVILPKPVLEELRLAVDTVRLRRRVFEDWGLAEIEPHPHAAISLHGEPGTGKTMVAHALARSMGRKVLPARASQLESKYHGEGGKYLDALFEAALRADAVLFIDEAESLLSRRFESVSQGSEHAVNTLRSELIQHLDRYEGVVVFATNLISSYDPAFISRLHHIDIPAPDRAARLEIWRAHLPRKLPREADVDLDRLARFEGVVGRDVKRAVVNAAVAAARRGATRVSHADLESALERVLAQRPTTGREPQAQPQTQAHPEPGRELSPAERAQIAAQITQQRDTTAPSSTE